MCLARAQPTFCPQLHARVTAYLAASGKASALSEAVPVFDNLAAALRDTTTARYRLGEDGARLEFSKPLGQGQTSTLFSAPWATSTVVKMVLPNLCRYRNASCPYAAFIVMGRAAGVPLAALQAQQIDSDLISGVWWALEVLRQLRIVHTDLHLNNLFVSSNADAVADQTSNWSVSIIDYGSSFTSARELNRTETLIKGGNNAVPHRAWVRFNHRCITAGQEVCNNTLLQTQAAGCRVVDQNVSLPRGNLASRERTLVQPDTLGRFQQKIVHEVSLQKQAARAGVSPDIYHAWLERDIHSTWVHKQGTSKK